MAGILADKIALITGSSRGLGRSIALSLAGAGAGVVLAARSQDNLAQVACEIEQQGGKVAAVIPTDLADESAIDHLVDSVAENCRRLDILVNNAAIAFAAPLEKTSTRDWDRCLAINARAPFILIRRALPLLRRADPGYVINISSVVGVKGYAYQCAYTASKHALRGLSIALAHELKPENIRVHVICPGGIDTDMVRSVRPDIKKSDLIAPEEIAELVLYLTTHQGQGIIDEIHLRRLSSEPWF